MLTSFSILFLTLNQPIYHLQLAVGFSHHSSVKANGNRHDLDFVHSLRISYSNKRRKYLNEARLGDTAVILK